MRNKIIAGNWKMNLSYAEAMALVDAVAEKIRGDQKTNVILAPPYIYLQEIAVRVHDHAMISVAAQNCSDKNSGAITGEVSASMLSSIGVDYVIIGHSERRKFFSEDNSFLSKKVKTVLEQLLIPIYCCGETADQRNAKKHTDTVREQIEKGLFHLDKNKIKECVIAYEPVWAIGTGVHASPQQAAEMHQFIRNLVKEKYDETIAGNISVLYGGSITSQNAHELFSCRDVDGGLVGGASLKADEFISICNVMEKIVK